MSITGIEVPDEVLEAYDRVKTDTKLKGITIAILNEKLVVDEFIYADFPTFVNSSVKEDEPRYIIYDFEVINRAGLTNKRLVLINWIPMASHVFKRMSYAGTKKMLRNHLQGIALDLHCEEIEELDYDAFLARFRKEHGVNV